MACFASMSDLSFSSYLRDSHGFGQSNVWALTPLLIFPVDGGDSHAENFSLAMDPGCSNDFGDSYPSGVTSDFTFSAHGPQGR
jgi:hypothetical protein